MPNAANQLLIQTIAHSPPMPPCQSFHLFDTGVLLNETDADPIMAGFKTSFFLTNGIWLDSNWHPVITTIGGAALPDYPPIPWKTPTQITNKNLFFFEDKWLRLLVCERRPPTTAKYLGYLPIQGFDPNELVAAVHGKPFLINGTVIDCNKHCFTIITDTGDDIDDEI